MALLLPHQLHHGKARALKGGSQCLVLSSLVPRLLLLEARLLTSLASSPGGLTVLLLGLILGL